MDTARQVIRWALPGWVILFFLALFLSVNQLFFGLDRLVFFQLISEMKDLLLELAAIAVPLGFIMYQIYYWIYWYAPVPYIIGKFVFSPGDRGNEILSSVANHPRFPELFESTVSQTNRSVYAKNRWYSLKNSEVMSAYRTNWELSDSVWYLALSNKRFEQIVEPLEKRNQFLTDIYHSLGVSYTALVLAFLGYLGITATITLGEVQTLLSYLVLPGSTKSVMEFVGVIIMLWEPYRLLISSLISLRLNFILFVLFFAMFRGGRKASFGALLRLKHDVITNALLDRPHILI